MESASFGNADVSAQKPSNITEYSVSAISGAIKRTLEGTFGRVRVRGEITELKRYPSGHVYLSLKDENAKISGVIWRGSVSRLGLAPENGTEVIATGRISSYGERSNYQLIIDRLEFAGEGALLARIEQLRRRFQQEGLFDQERKKPLPFLPRRIGVITSRAGAVLHDICTTLSRRFPCEVLLWPVAVQGEGAASQIATALEGIVQGPDRPDVIIVARGGGSLEDLMAFNEERVIRAVAACPLPVISAVGHETDTTLIDFVSDRRAPTPTAAAEIAMPLRSELVADLAHRAARLINAFIAIRQRLQMRLERLTTALPDLPSFLDLARMKLDDRSQRLALALPAQMTKARAALNARSCTLPAPGSLLERREMTLFSVKESLEAVWQRFMQNHQTSVLRIALRPEILQARLRLEQTRLQGIERHLVAVSPRAILERGYVMVQDHEGRPVTSSDSLKRQALVSLHFADGRREAQLDPLHEGSVSPRKRKDGPVRKEQQGELEL